MALNLYLRVYGGFGPTRGFYVSYRGSHPERIPLDESNLIVRAARGAAERVGAEIIGGEIGMDSEIPVSAGFGSSAAAIIAGILLAARHLGRPFEAEAVLEMAAAIEGHPDNVAAAYLGGLIVAAREESGSIRVARAQVPQDLDFIAVIPDFEMPTERARAVLPASYLRADAVANLQRLALLVGTCFSGEFRLAPELFRDRLHQPYRAPLVPGMEACLELRHPDLLGVFLSGAGSTVLAIARRGGTEIGDWLAGEFARHGLQTQVLFLKAENRGACDFFETDPG
jgi:homoserine kinase